eukprot:52774_1
MEEIYKQLTNFDLKYFLHYAIKDTQDEKIDFKTTSEMKHIEDATVKQIIQIFDQLLSSKFMDDTVYNYRRELRHFITQQKMDGRTIKQLGPRQFSDLATEFCGNSRMKTSLIQLYKDIINFDSFKSVNQNKQKFNSNTTEYVSSSIEFNKQNRKKKKKRKIRSIPKQIFLLFQNVCNTKTDSIDLSCIKDELNDMDHSLISVLFENYVTAVDGQNKGRNAVKWDGECDTPLTRLLSKSNKNDENASDDTYLDTLFRYLHRSLSINDSEIAKFRSFLIEQEYDSESFNQEAEYIYGNISNQIYGKSGVQEIRRFVMESIVGRSEYRINDSNLRLIFPNLKRYKNPDGYWINIDAMIRAKQWEERAMEQMKYSSGDHLSVIKTLIKIKETSSYHFYYQMIQNKNSEWSQFILQNKLVKWIELSSQEIGLVVSAKKLLTDMYDVRESYINQDYVYNVLRFINKITNIKNIYYIDIQKPH